MPATHDPRCAQAAIRHIAWARLTGDAVAPSTVDVALAFLLSCATGCATLMAHAPAGVNEKLTGANSRRDFGARLGACARGA